MIESAVGTVQEAAPIAPDPAPAVGGAQEAEVAGSGTELPKLPGYTLQLTSDQQAALKARVAADPATLAKLPKGLAELYAQFDQLQTQNVGAVKRPAQDAPKEAWDQFYKELGRPESAEGYTLDKPQIPSGMRYDDSAEKWFRGVAHSIGLTQDQAKGFFEAYNKIQMEGHQRVQAARVAAKDAAINALKVEWKDSFPDKWEGIRQAYQQFIPEGANGPLFKKLQAYGLDNDPDFLRMFKNIYDKIGPPKMVVPSGEGSGQDKKATFNFKVDGIGRA
jgi:hypothetical protein